MTRTRRLYAALLAAALTLSILATCNDWDGMDRSGWQPTPTMGGTLTPVECFVIAALTVLLTADGRDHE